MMKKSPSNKRNVLFFGIFALVLALAGGGYFWYQTSLAAATPTEAPMQTTKVRTGDLVLTASGSGNIVPRQQVELGFRSSGIVRAVPVSAGQQVGAGEILATLEDSLQQAQLAQAQAEFEALFSAASLAKAKITLANAQIAQAAAQEELQYLISPDVYYWETELETAQVALKEASTEEQKSAAQKALERAQTNLALAQKRYTAEYVPGVFAYTYTDLETEEEIETTLAPSAEDIALARAALDSARFAVADANAYLEILQAGAASVTAPLAAVQGTETAKIEQARLNLENARLNLANTQLTAPFAGVVLAINALPGQTINTSPFLTLATTADLQVRFYLDETDLDKARPGNRLNLTLDAFPDAALPGEITAVEQALQTVDGTPVIVLWGTFSNPENLTILSGMSVDVEVIGGEAQNALLVPVQALREIAPGSYAIFLVGADGALKLTPVQVGLRDFANAEILSGLKVGDVVSTGTVETK